MKAPRICSPASRLLFSCRSSVKFRSAFPSSALTFDSLVFPFFSFSYAFPECFSPFPPSPSVFFAPFLLPLLLFFLFFIFFCFSKTTTPFFFFQILFFVSPSPRPSHPSPFPCSSPKPSFSIFLPPVFSFLFRRAPAFFRLFHKLPS